MNATCEGCDETLTEHGFHVSTGTTRCPEPPIMFEGRPEQLTDGYHTMQELYDHRRALTAVLAGAAAQDKDSWRSKAHHPHDDPMFEGHFIVGIVLPTGTITYHFKLDHWDDFAAVPELTHAPQWDKATPADTVKRLKELANLLASPEWMVTQA